MDETEFGILVIVYNHDSIGVVRWMNQDDNEVLTKVLWPKEGETSVMKLLYDDGSELRVSVITCSGTLYYSAFRIWTFPLDQVPYFAA